jgi:DNA-binding NtrC family response regulator
MKRSVFYFDDEAEQVDVFEEMFGGEYDVRTATTLKEARRLLAEGDPDIIISDLKMPEIEGTEFLREAARMCPHSFRILLTGYGQIGDVIGDVSSRIINLFVTKPWTEDHMRQVLGRASITFLHSRAH